MKTTTAPWISSIVVFGALGSQALVAPASFANGWEYQGCYVYESKDVGRTINAASTSGAGITNEQCTSFCFQNGLPYAGTEFSDECYCGQTLATGGVNTTATDCSMACSGNATEVCGGPNRLTLYKTNAITGPVVNPGVSGWSSIGCYAEGTNGRALATQLNSVPSNGMTVALCTAACKSAGFILAGLEFAGECWCGNTIANGGAPATSGCNMVCNGNKTEFCGGASRLNVYDFMMEFPTGGGTATKPPATSSTKAGSAPPTKTSSTTAVQPTGLPAGWSSFGCWVDGVSGRILNNQQPDSQTLTLQSCAATCAGLGYTIAGAEFSTQCFCGNSIVNGGVQATDPSQCNTACSGNSQEECGGPSRMSIMSKGTPQVLGPPAPIQHVGNWTYQGCYQDNVNQQRTFFWQNIFQNTMTPSQCLNACGAFGYMAAGLEYGDECYCGDPANIVTVGSTKVADSQCNVPCAGNASAICGGGSLLSTYFWEGDPFYTWSFPAAGTAAAGRYEYLVGGVCIPLMTMQSVTGKVSFVEKWGTGEPNSTGAYELDLSLVEQPFKMWREMHLKTDVFCAAGTILPDKAGRQLTVGGWSGDSTFGVRLYSPDGSNGVNGTNDWEENVNVLKLQDGRWYPTTMNMANGSILVVGGEEGSNGAPVPTLEILPPTGTAPLFMDWLERTDPNNLYPFMAVLPSGGILAAYWNEARILDENTFATTKVLPNITGAVNDPLAGRTYPLEGAVALLPQHAPYTDPLEVLICGGSNNGPGNALDNCVSIIPEAATPSWRLERMPSTRVMPCMAPLPDGTYVILNGAHHGVAGFGLATNPNLNALLYDPTKPYGSRITIMANTTVARLYHSEAITLLDGRVLISGSDPEDGVNPQEYRVEVFMPPYLLNGKPRPSFTIGNKDWSYGATVSFTLGGAAKNGAITASLLGAVSSTHGNSMGGRTLIPAVSCSGTSCTVTAPPNAHVAPPGWYQLFVLDGGIPAVGVYVRIGGDPAKVGNWPNDPGFTLPGV